MLVFSQRPASFCLKMEAGEVCLAVHSQGTLPVFSVQHSLPLAVSKVTVTFVQVR